MRGHGLVTTCRHRFSLGDTGWYLWRDALLRTTGN